MKLTAKLAKDIVSSSMEILGKNVNIMDENGIILASGDRARVNTFHQGAAEVIKTQETLEINKREKLKGSVPGINLPIEFDGKVIGVVGITGNPEEVRDYGRLVKNSVELMLKQSFILQQLQTETKAREHFLHEMLIGNINYDEDFSEKTKILGCEIHLPLVAIVIEIKEIAEIPLQQWLGELPRRELDLEYIVASAVKQLTQSNNDIITSIGSSRLVILRFIASNVDNGSLIKSLTNCAIKYKEELMKSFSLKVRIGIGGIAHDITDTCRTYKEACLVLKIAERLYYKGEIHHWNDIGLGFLLDTASQEVANHFSNSVKLKNLNNPELINTFRVFLDCNLRVSEAAKKMYVHRNTLTYRLNQIKEITGLDPRIFYDALRIYLAILLDKYYNSIH